MSTPNFNTVGYFADSQSLCRGCAYQAYPELESNEDFYNVIFDRTGYQICELVAWEVQDGDVCEHCGQHLSELH